MGSVVGGPPTYSAPSLPTQQGILAWAVSLVGFPDGKREEEEEEEALWGGSESVEDGRGIRGQRRITDLFKIRSKKYVLYIIVASLKS